MTETIFAVESFIKEYLIKQIGEVKETHPYFAFLLMAAGIEFLGKCQNSLTDWQITQPYGADFAKGLSLFPPKYQNMDLYRKLRCGMAHAFVPDNGLYLADEKGQDSTVLYCDEFYNDFKDACNKILSGKVPMPKKKLTDSFMTVKDDGNNRFSGETSQTIVK